MTNPFLDQLWRRLSPLPRTGNSRQGRGALALGLIPKLWLGQILFLQAAILWNFREPAMALCLVHIFIVGMAVTVVAAEGIANRLRALRRSGQMDALLLTPLTGGQITWGLVAATVLPLWILWAGTIVITLAHRGPFADLDLILVRSSSDLWPPLALSIPIVAIHTLHCTAVSFPLHLTGFNRPLMSSLAWVMILWVTPILFAFTVSLTMTLLGRGWLSPLAALWLNLAAVLGLDLALIRLTAHFFHPLCRPEDSFPRFHSWFS